MDGKTIRALSEMMAEHHRKERKRNEETYHSIYDTAVTDTNGVEQDWEDDKED